KGAENAGEENPEGRVLGIADTCTVEIPETTILFLGQRLSQHTNGPQPGVGLQIQLGRGALRELQQHGGPPDSKTRQQFRERIPMEKTSRIVDADAGFLRQLCSESLG